jgi:hypothetical protein
MKRTKRIYRNLVVALLGIATSILILLAVIPSILSSTWGKNSILVPLINRAIPGTISLQKIHLSWFRDQSLEGLQIHDPSGAIVIAIDRLKTDTSLWSLLHSPPRLGKLEIENFNANLLQDEKGITNLERALSVNPKPSLEGENSIAGRLREISFKNVNARLILPSMNTPLIAYFDGATSHNSLTGHFDIEATIHGFIMPPDFWSLPFSFSHFFKQDVKPIVKLKAEVTNLPVPILDQLAGLALPEAEGILLAAFGERLNLTLNQTADSFGTVIELDLQTANLKGNFLGRFNNGAFELTEPGHLSLNVNSDLISIINQFLLPSPILKIDQKANVDLAFHTLRIPIRSHSIAPFEIHAYLTVPRIELNDETSFKDSTIEISTLENSSKLQAIIQSLISSDNQTGDLSLNAIVPLAETPFTKTEDRRFPSGIELRVESQGIPTKHLASFFNNKILLETLGERIAFEGKATTTSQDIDIEAKISTKQLAIDNLHLKINESFTLLEPTMIRYSLNPSLFQKIAPTNLQLALRRDVPINMTIHKLTFPIDEKISRAERPTIIQATIKADPIAFTNLPGIDDLEIRSLHWNFSGLSLDQIESNLIAEIVQPLISDVIHLDMHAKSAINLEGELDINSFSALISNRGQSELRISGQALGLFSGKEAIENKNVLTAQGSFNYALTPKMLERLGLNRNSVSRINTPLSIRVAVDSMEIPLVSHFLNKMRASARIDIDSLSLTNTENEKLGSLKNIVANFAVNGPENKVTGNLLAQTKSPTTDDLGTLKINASLSNWCLQEESDLSQVCIDATGEVQHLPIAIVETFLDMDNLATLVGPSLDLQFTLNTLSSNNSAGLINLQLQGTQFQANAELKVDQTISLRDPSRPVVIDWTVTPERFTEIRKKILSENSDRNDLLLNSATSMIAKISDFSLPWKNTQEKTSNPRWIHTAATVNLSLDKVSITDKKKKRTTTLDAIAAKLSTHDLAQALVFEWNTRGYSDVGSSTAASELKFRGVIDNPLTPKGKINTQELSVGVDALAKQAPIVLLCDFFCLGDEMINQVDVLIGDHLDADVHMRLTNFNGPLNLILKGSQGQLTLDGQLTNGILTLNKPLKAQVTVTPKLSHSLLQDLVPFMSTAVSSDNPISVTIDPEGFSFPLYSWNLQKISFDRLVVDFGRVYFRNDMQIAQILTLLNFLPASSSDLLSIWFTPLYASMKNGIVYCDRMDMLAASKYSIAIWGNVDFIEDKVNMMVGLNGNTLKQAFGVKGVPPHAMLQLPFKGTTSDASIDKTKATAKVSALVAQNQGTPHGAILGGILDLLAGTYGEKAPPKPTTQPFPWEQEK